MRWQLPAPPGYTSMNRLRSSCLLPTWMVDRWITSLQVDYLANLESATMDGRNQCTAASVLEAVAGAKGGQNGWLPLGVQRSASEFYHCLCRTWSPAEWRAAGRVAIDHALAEDGV